MPYGYTESCLQYEGELLYFDPHHGWGWCQIRPDDAPLPMSENGVPAPCHLRVDHFYRYRGVWRGAVTRLEEASHIYDGMWAVFYYRAGFGESDLKEDLPTVDILFGPDEPQMREWDEPKMAEMWPCWQSEIHQQVGGYGIVAVTFEDIKRDEQKVRKP